MRRRIREVFDLEDEAPSELRHEKSMEQIIAAFPHLQATEVAQFLDALLSKTSRDFPRILGLIRTVLDDAQPDKPYKFIKQMDLIYRHLSPRGVSELTTILECFKAAPSLLYDKVDIIQDHYLSEDGHLHPWYSSRPITPSKSSTPTSPKEKEPDLSHCRSSGRNGDVYRTPTDGRRYTKGLDT